MLRISRPLNTCGGECYLGSSIYKITFEVIASYTVLFYKMRCQYFWYKGYCFDFHYFFVHKQLEIYSFQMCLHRIHSCLVHSSSVLNDVYKNVLHLLLSHLRQLNTFKTFYITHLYTVLKLQFVILALDLIDRSCD